MKITCCWMYAIGKYGFPPLLKDMFKAIDEMAEMGFDYIELEGLGYDNLRQVILNKKEIKSSCKSNGLEVSNFAILLPEIISMDQNKQNQAFELFKYGVETAAYLDSPFVWIDSFNPPIKVTSGKPLNEDLSFGRDIDFEIPNNFNWGSFWNHFVDAIGKATEIVGEYDMNLLIEPRVGEVTSNSEALIRLGEALNNEHFGVILDTAHQHAQKEMLPLSIHKLKDILQYVHIADNKGRENHHYQIGNGNIDWDAIFLNLKQINYESFYAIDLEEMPNLGEKFKSEKRVLEYYENKYNL